MYTHMFSSRTFRSRDLKARGRNAGSLTDLELQIHHQAHL